MAKLTFKLREGKPKGGIIQLVFNYGSNKRLRYSTGLRVQDIKNWDSKNMKIKMVVGEIDRAYVNNKLNELKSYFEREYHRLTLEEGRQINNQILKDICDSFFDKNKVKGTQEQLELLPFFEWFIENYSVKPLMSTGKPLKKGTAKTYKNAYNLLKRFTDEKYRLSYEKINVKFYNDFLNWLYESNYSTNYIGTQIKTLKTILNASLELGYHNSIEHTRKYFKKPTEEVKNIYLNQNELQKLYELDLSDVMPIRISKSLYLTPDKLGIARDLFLISANTGLRVSDFNKLNKENILESEGKLFFKLITQKNQKPLTIPINTMVKSILNKRQGNPPPGIPNQHINYALKELGRLAEINSEVEIEKTIGGIKTSETKLKYELITNHTGRRSFCTNAYLSEMPTIDIMAISGHSTEKVFYNYIKVNDLQRAQKISEHKFFN